MEHKALLRQIPKVDTLILGDCITPFYENTPRSVIVTAIRSQLDVLRQEILAGRCEEAFVNGVLDMDVLNRRLVQAINAHKQMSLRRVVNATGTILHTNLGRSLISKKVMEHVYDTSVHYSNLEYNIEEGTRGSRHSHVEDIITQLTGTEAAMVVNNNAAAVMMVLNTVAEGKEVVVSRGELVEIGGSFRVPEIMGQSGAVLHEIGTTNKTHLKDYENAVSEEETAALLKVHTSNYRILGFTKEVSLEELVDMGHRCNLPVIHDLGSGALIDLHTYGIYDEPTVMDSVKAGADIICFSGDKLLGGTQAGIIIGRKRWIDQMKKNPLARILRVDKLTLSALEGTLKLYQSKEEAVQSIPTLKMLHMTKEETKEKANRLMNEIGVCEHIDLKLIEGSSQIGGGSVPLHQLESWIVEIKHYTMSVNDMEKVLREQKIPIIARIQKDALILDVRTIEDDSLEYVAKVIKSIL